MHGTRRVRSVVDRGEQLAASDSRAGRQQPRPLVGVSTAIVRSG